MSDRFLSWVGAHVYGGIIPVEQEDLVGAKNYLPQLWREAPLYVAFLQTALAVFILVAPVFTRGRLFSALCPEIRENFYGELLFSKIYLLRLVAYGVRGQAAVAIFSDIEVRKKYFGSKISWERLSYWNQKVQSPTSVNTTT